MNNMSVKRLEPPCSNGSLRTKHAREVRAHYQPTYRKFISSVCKSRKGIKTATARMRIPFILHLQSLVPVFAELQNDDTFITHPSLSRP